MLEAGAPAEERFWLYDSLGAVTGIYENKKGEYVPVKMVYEESDTLK
jgi:hypothetical protein